MGVTFSSQSELCPQIPSLLPVLGVLHIAEQTQFEKSEKPTLNPD